jgi:adenylate kinase family enzyme
VGPEVFRASAAEALGGAEWVVDGNYSMLRDLVWGRADTVVWLDYAFPVVMARLLWRTLRRAATREELWSGNRESWRLSFFSRDSILWWGITTYRRRRRAYPAQLELPEHAHLQVVHLRSPREADAWLAALGLPTISTIDEGPSDD